jgi:hypothetical protein
MKKTIQLLTACCLALFMLIFVTDGVSAATASSVWVDGIQMTDGDYLATNEATAVTTGAMAEPVSYVAWYHNGTLTLNNAEIATGKTAQVYNRTGACAIYAVGNLSIVLNGINVIGSNMDLADVPLCGINIADGNLEISSQSQGSVNIFGDYMGICANNGDVSFSGNVDVLIGARSNDADLSCSIFVMKGDVVIKDQVEIDTDISDSAEWPSVNPKRVSGIYVYGGNVTLSGHAYLRINSYRQEESSYGIRAISMNERVSGNVTVSGRAKLEVDSGNAGIFADKEVAILEHTSARVSAKNYGIDARSLTVNKGHLKVSYYGTGAPIKDGVSLTLNQAYLGVIGVGSTYFYDPEDLAKIKYDPVRGNYFYGSNPVMAFVFFPEYAGDYYSDCIDWDWATPYNYFVIENGIMGSVYNGSKFFDSKGTVTRGMVVTVMYRLAGSPALTEDDYARYNEKFSDVKKSDWYYDAIVWAYNNGVTEGISDTGFAPLQKTSREQIVTFFWRFCDFLGCDNAGDATLNDFKDLSQVSDYAVDAFQWSVTNDIVNGTSNTTLSPKAPCTRGQMAKIISIFALTFIEDKDWIEIGTDLDFYLY